jgi:hypothetical protein
MAKEVRIDPLPEGPLNEGCVTVVMCHCEPCGKNTPQRIFPGVHQDEERGPYHEAECPECHTQGRQYDNE